MMSLSLSAIALKVCQNWQVNYKQVPAFYYDIGEAKIGGEGRHAYVENASILGKGHLGSCN
jgi:hypothetical protein